MALNVRQFKTIFCNNQIETYSEFKGRGKNPEQPKLIPLHSFTPSPKTKNP